MAPPTTTHPPTDESYRWWRRCCGGGRFFCFFSPLLMLSVESTLCGFFIFTLFCVPVLSLPVLVISLFLRPSFLCGVAWVGLFCRCFDVLFAPVPLGVFLFDLATRAFPLRLGVMICFLFCSFLLAVVLVVARIPASRSLAPLLVLFRATLLSEMRIWIFFPLPWSRHRFFVRSVLLQFPLLLRLIR